ncbi:MAG: pirin family protein [Actinomycetota bacterium]
MSATIVRSNQRFETNAGWLESFHSFSFGGHYDPRNTHHGLLLVANDDTVRPGQGFGTHGHRDMEIVSWVLEGELEHRDSEGNHGVIRPGLIQRMSAGTGIQHSEMNGSATESVHFLQMWVPPDTTGIAPGYEELDVGDRLDSGDLVVVASGQGHEGAVRLHQAEAVMAVARPPEGAPIEIDTAPAIHLYVARGAVTTELDGEPVVLGEGDALRLFDRGVAVTGAADSTEIVVWSTGVGQA